MSITTAASVVMLESRAAMREQSGTAAWSVADGTRMLAELRDALPGDEGSRLANQAAKKMVSKHPTLSHLKRAFTVEGLNYK
jgi:hypothetical protein